MTVLSNTNQTFNRSVRWGAAILDLAPVELEVWLSLAKSKLLPECVGNNLAWHKLLFLSGPSLKVDLFHDI